MKQVVKQVVGIDVGKDTFYACYKIKFQDSSISLKGAKSFDNNYKGFSALSEWCAKRNKTTEIKPIYVMEATGVYYEELAYFLHGTGELVSVHLAQKIKYFAKSCNLKTKTDKVDSKMIAEFGIEKNLQGTDFWTPPSKEFKLIRDMAREHTSLKRTGAAAKSQLHAMNHAHGYSEKMKEMKKQQIAFYEEQIKEVEAEIKRKVAEDKKLASKIKRITKIKGIRIISVVKIITEVNGFLLFNNIRQLVSYAGLDVVENQSGNHRGKTKISKKGNARLRSVLYFPAITASNHNKTLKKYYERIIENRTYKNQGTVAVMRKMLILVYTLWKKDEEYIEDYLSVKQKNKGEVLILNH